MADLLLAATMIALFLWLGESLRVMLLQNELLRPPAEAEAAPPPPEDITPKLQARIVEQGNIIDELQKKIRAQTIATEGLNQEISHLRDTHLHDRPPFIRLDEGKVLVFDRGSAKPQNEVREIWTPERLVELTQMVSVYQVDVIEVIGHTDDEPVTSSSSNLDRKLTPVLAGQASATSLRAGSNADLGLARATVVAEQLREIIASRPELHGVQVRCYSAGQGIVSREIEQLPDGKEKDKRRRRIELRFLRSAEEREATEAPGR